MSFRAGDHGEIFGVEWRIVRGRKHPEDLRLEIRTPKFLPVSMVLGYLFADFYAQNERVLYPHIRDAGRRYRIAIHGAQTLGWQDAADQLAYEREQANARRLGEPEGEAA